MQRSAQQRKVWERMTGEMSGGFTKKEASVSGNMVEEERETHLNAFVPSGACVSSATGGCESRGHHWPLRAFIGSLTLPSESFLSSPNTHFLLSLSRSFFPFAQALADPICLSLSLSLSVHWSTLSPLHCSSPDRMSLPLEPVGSRWSSE